MIRLPRVVTLKVDTRGVILFLKTSKKWNIWRTFSSTRGGGVIYPIMPTGDTKPGCQWMSWIAGLLPRDTHPAWRKVPAGAIAYPTWTNKILALERKTFCKGTGVRFWDIQLKKDINKVGWCQSRLPCWSGLETLPCKEVAGSFRARDSFRKPTAVQDAFREWDWGDGVRPFTAVHDHVIIIEERFRVDTKRDFLPMGRLGSGAGSPGKLCSLSPRVFPGVTEHPHLISKFSLLWGGDKTGDILRSLPAWILQFSNTLWFSLIKQKYCYSILCPLWRFLCS